MQMIKESLQKVILFIQSELLSLGGKEMKLKNMLYRKINLQKTLRSPLLEETMGTNNKINMETKYHYVLGSSFLVQ